MGRVAGNAGFVWKIRDMAQEGKPSFGREACSSRRLRVWPPRAERVEQACRPGIRSLSGTCRQLFVRESAGKGNGLEGINRSAALQR